MPKYLQVDNCFGAVGTPNAVWFNNNLYFGGCSAQATKAWNSEITVSKWSPLTNETTTYVVDASGKGGDNHNSTSVLALATGTGGGLDGKIAAAWTYHGDTYVRFALSTNAEDISSWGSTYLNVDVGGAITNVAVTSNVATITTSAAHNMTNGMKVSISGLTNTFLNTTSASPPDGTPWTITGVPTATTFTFAVTHADLGSTADAGRAIAETYEYGGFLCQLSADSNALHWFYVPLIGNGGIDGHRVLRHRRSTDGGVTWGAYETVYDPSSGHNYFFLYSNGVDRIDFAVNTEGRTTSVLYHGYLKYSGATGTFYTSGGSSQGVSGSLAGVALTTANLTLVLNDTGNSNGVFALDIAQNSGNVAIGCQVCSSDGATNYIRRPYWNGSSWTNTTVNIIGPLTAHVFEASVVGGIAINRTNLDELAIGNYVSSQWETEIYATSNSGTTWTKTGNLGTPPSAAPQYQARWVQNNDGTAKWLYNQGPYTTFGSQQLTTFLSPATPPTVFYHDTTIAADNTVWAGGTYYSPCGGLVRTINGATQYKISGNKVYLAGTAAASARISAGPDQANYSHEMSITFTTFRSGDVLGPLVRATDTNVLNGYAVIYIGGGSAGTGHTLRLDRWNAGSVSFGLDGASYAIPTMTAGDTHKLRIEAVTAPGGNVIVSVFWDDVRVKYYIDSSGSKITAAGVPAVYAQNTTAASASVGPRFTSLIGKDVPTDYTMNLLPTLYL